MNVVNQLTPVEVVRDECGFWSHPVYLEYALKMLDGRESCTAEEWKKLQADLGVEIQGVNMEYDAPTWIYEKYVSEGDIAVCKEWQPSKPDDVNDWFMIDLHDHEDFGAVCLWAKSICEKSEVA